MLRSFLNHLGLNGLGEDAWKHIDRRTFELFRENVFFGGDASRILNQLDHVAHAAPQRSHVGVSSFGIRKHLENLIDAAYESELIVPLKHSLVGKATVIIRITHLVIRARVCACKSNSAERK